MFSIYISYFFMLLSLTLCQGGKVCLSPDAEEMRVSLSPDQERAMAKVVSLIVSLSQQTITSLILTLLEKYQGIGWKFHLDVKKTEKRILGGIFQKGHF